MELKLKGFDFHEPIGFGGFGTVYRGHDQAQKIDVAIKVENIRSGNLSKEAKVLKCMRSVKGFPQYYGFAVKGSCNCLIMQLLSRSLSDIFKLKERTPMPLVYVLQCFKQVLNRLCSLHGKGIIHRDIKPSNIMLGLPKPDGNPCKTLYLVDFGLAAMYCNPESGQHISKKLLRGTGFNGTFQYASMNTHRGINQSRRDDLECLLYSMAYLAKAELPWTGLENSEIVCKKLDSSPKEICRGLPEQFVTMLTYIQALTFEQAPDYRYLVQLIVHMRQELRTCETVVRGPAENTTQEEEKNGPEHATSLQNPQFLTVRKPSPKRTRNWAKTRNRMESKHIIPPMEHLLPPSPARGETLNQGRPADGSDLSQESGLVAFEGPQQEYLLPSSFSNEKSNSGILMSYNCTGAPIPSMIDEIVREQERKQQAAKDSSSHSDKTEEYKTGGATQISSAQLHKLKQSATAAAS